MPGMLVVFTSKSIDVIDRTEDKNPRTNPIGAEKMIKFSLFVIFFFKRTTHKLEAEGAHRIKPSPETRQVRSYRMGKDHQASHRHWNGEIETSGIGRPCGHNNGGLCVMAHED